MFDEPDEVGGGGGPRLYPRDVLNHLLIVYSIDYIEHSPTRFTKPGDRADVTVVDVIDLDLIDPDTNQPGLLARKVWWRGARLNGSLKGKVGSGTPLLARMAHGPATQGMPPYVLNSMTQDPQAVARANGWFAANPGFKPSDKPVRWAGTDDPQDVGPDASFTPTTSTTSGGINIPADHQQALRDAVRPATALEEMARRATLPPTTPPQSEVPPF